jgi:site-specific recombinase XerC
MSKRALKDLMWSVDQYSKSRTQNLSFASRISSAERLKTTFKDLHAMGYEIRHARNLKASHVDALVSHWKEEGLNAGTIKNRMSDLRAMCDHYGRHHTVKTSNDAYDIEKRSYTPTHNKAINEISLSNIKDPHLILSLELQKEFGLRREECLKIKPEQSLIERNGNHYLQLQRSWTRGGIERTIPITNTSQLEAVRRAIDFVGSKSMIPQDKSYIVSERKRIDIIWNKASGPVISNEVFKLRFLIAIFHVVF